MHIVFTVVYIRVRVLVCLYVEVYCHSTINGHAANRFIRTRYTKVLTVQFTSNVFIYMSVCVSLVIYVWHMYMCMRFANLEKHTPMYSGWKACKFARVYCDILDNMYSFVFVCRSFYGFFQLSSRLQYLKLITTQYFILFIDIYIWLFIFHSFCYFSFTEIFTS